MRKENRKISKFSWKFWGPIVITNLITLSVAFSGYWFSHMQLKTTLQNNIEQLKISQQFTVDEQTKQRKYELRKELLNKRFERLEYTYQITSEFHKKLTGVHSLIFSFFNKNIHEIQIDEINNLMTINGDLGTSFSQTMYVIHNSITMYQLDDLSMIPVWFEYHNIPLEMFKLSLENFEMLLDAKKDQITKNLTPFIASGINLDKKFGQYFISQILILPSDYYVNLEKLEKLSDQLMNSYSKLQILFNLSSSKLLNFEIEAL